ncbi:MAG: TadE/TadG family type IV pilus assembly protein [Pseudomonadota bacterium]
MVVKACQSWVRDTRGNIAMLFGVIVVPVLLVVAFAIDSSRELSTAKHLQAAIDAASLAGARALEDATQSDEEVRQIALTSLSANLESSHSDMACAQANVTVNRELGTVNVQSQCQINALFGGTLTPEDMSVASAATAKANVTKLDLALMLDVSGSMGGEKIADLRTAAITTAQTLITPAAGDRVRISFVSYATSVNAGAYGNPVLGRPANDDSDGDGLGTVCVSERTGTAAWNDDEPELGKWVGDLAADCPTSSLLPLTNNLSLFESEINSLVADGWTAGHLGVAWSWYLISPDWSDIWPSASEPLAYNEPNTVKAVILMTDGMFNREYVLAQGDSEDQATRMCDEMRDQQVLVYSVAFQAPPDAIAILRDCAGDDSRFFDASNGEELLDAYAAIASQLSALTLVD